MPTSRSRRSRLLVVTLVALGAAPAAAAAADTLVVPGAAAQRMTALDGVVVWVAGSGSNGRLMRRTAAGTVSRVKGAPTGAYPSIDLGRDAAGKLVLTYLRCVTARTCSAWSDRLDGRRTRFTKLAPKRCALTTAPSRWLSRVAYGLACTKRTAASYESDHDARRSGLFVRRGAGAARRLALPNVSAPEPEVGFTIDVRWVDLRGTTVAAALNVPGMYVSSTTYTQTVVGKRLRSSDLGAGGSGEEIERADAHLESLTLGSGGVLWTFHATPPFEGAPGSATINRGFTCARGTFSCADGSSCPDVVDALPNLIGANQPGGGVPTAMAVDGSTIYVAVPGTGIVIHDFEADPAFEC